MGICIQRICFIFVLSKYIWKISAQPDAISSCPAPDSVILQQVEVLQFMLFTGDVLAAEASEICETEGAVLGVIDNLDDFNLVQALVNSVNPVQDQYWFGRQL